MVRDGGLIERERGPQVAHADLIFGSTQRRKNRQPMRITKRLEDRRFVGPLGGITDRREGSIVALTYFDTSAYIAIRQCNNCPQSAEA